jgi:(p)ppGpp synthase/HD superfamily hydrolase
LVEELTSDSFKQKEVGKTAYLCEKMARMSDWGLVIKLCDRLDNVTDFAFAPTKFVNKYAKETMDIIAHLRVHYILTQTQQNIIRDIEKMVAIYWKEAI